MQAEHAADTVAVADGSVAVFDRRGKVTLLERAAHLIELAFRNAALKDKSLGTAADRAGSGGYDDFIRLG